ncbi:hypothetical protein ACFXKH_32030 [Streptomyces caelestis]
MVHPAVNGSDPDHDAVHWPAPVTDEEYAAAPAADRHPARTATTPER